MSKKKTHKEFIQELYNKCPLYRNGDFVVLGKYKTNHNHIVIKNKYGYLRVRPVEILRKCNQLKTSSAIFKDNYFRELLRDKSKSYRKGNYKLHSEYKGVKEVIYVENKYGILKSTPADLLAGKTPSILSAVDKIEYVHNILNLYNDSYKEGNFKVLKVMSRYIILEDKYGKYKSSLPNLVKNCKITYQTSINLGANIKKRLIEKLGNRYDYSLIKDIDNTTDKLKIICKKHGVFEQTFYHHYYSESGCPKCGTIEGAKKLKDSPTGWSHTRWVEAAEKSKDFDSFKMYIIKFKEKETDEEFFKIGRTYLTINKRFSQINKYYNKKIIHIFESDDPKKIIEKEIELLKLNKENSFTPTRNFSGKGECFTKVDYD